VVKNLYKSIGFTGKTFKCQIGFEPVEDCLWAIITSSVNKNNES